MGNAALLNGRSLMGAPPSPQLNIATPMNDAQMLVLAAAAMDSAFTPAEAVDRAIALTVEAVVKARSLPALIEARKRQETTG